MDLAQNISEASTEIFKNECLLNTCDISITLHNRYKYNITIIPMSKHILIKYKTIEYKVSREDSVSYENIINFLIEAIDDDADTSLNVDIEYTGYWPDQDEEFCKNSLIIKRHKEVVFGLEFSRQKFESVMQMYMKCMLNLN